LLVVFLQNFYPSQGEEIFRMTYWEGKAASASNLRLLDPPHGWRAHDDASDSEGRTTAPGSIRAIELALHSALNASNLLLVTGAGSSFCAHNVSGKTAPSMKCLWDAVEVAVTPPKFHQIIGLIPDATNLNKNIEKLLTLCKLYSVLFNDADATKIASFVVSAEKAIVDRVNFVDDTTELGSHRNLIRKFARRSVRKPRARIFTTNYDLCFEYAAREQQFVVVDGFSHSCHKPMTVHTSGTTLYAVRVIPTRRTISRTSFTCTSYMGLSTGDGKAR
jgi:hypothetical protein